MYISNMLSLASMPVSKTDSHTFSYQIFQVQEEQNSKYRGVIEDINVEEALLVTDKRLSSIKCATTKDSSLHTLMNTIKDGWPEMKAEVPLCIREYWPTEMNCTHRMDSPTVKQES